ncbi:MAG: ABC transporter ATP-binding protein/permease [Magnetococcus sp. DMHC-1]
MNSRNMDDLGKKVAFLQLFDNHDEWTIPHFPASSVGSYNKKQIMKTAFPDFASFLKFPGRMRLQSTGSISLAQRLRYLRPHYRRHLRQFAIGFLLLAATSLSAASIPYAMKLATDALLAEASVGTMSGFAALLVVLALINGAFRIAGRVHIFRIGRQIEYDLRNDLHRQLLRLDNAFFDRERTGDLVSRCTTDITSVRMFIGPGFLQISNAVMVYLTLLPIMMSLDPFLTLMALLPFPFVLVLTRLLTSRLYRLSRKVADRFGHTSGFVQESIAGMAVLRAHAQEDNWRHRFALAAQTLYTDQMRHARLQSLFAPVMMFSGGLGAWIILAVSGPEVASGRLTIGDFVAFSGYLAQLVWPTVGLGWILTVMQRGLVALERIGEILDRNPSIPANLPAANQASLPPVEAPPAPANLSLANRVSLLHDEASPAPANLPAANQASLPRVEAVPPVHEPFLHLDPPAGQDPAGRADTGSRPFRGRIQVEDLTFHFPGPAAPSPGNPILEAIHLDIQPGQFIGLAGRVGSGKSTLLNCLARLHPVPAGTIRIDGEDLMAIDEHRLRRHLAMVPQESILFSTTMRDNLLFGAPYAPEEKAWDVARRSHMAEEIRAFPAGMATLVGERGITLSGGQRQRTALARALVMDPNILLLDDVFSSVDAQTEATILEQIRRDNPHRTTLMVCHRVAALHDADQIVLLEHGRIAARGTHSELIVSSPLYQDLHHRMLRHEAMEALQ